jgi:hypothetical protein
VDIYDSNSREQDQTKNEQMGYTTTDTVSCRLLPSQIAELRELAATKKVSLSRFVSELCVTTIQGRHQEQSGTHKSPIIRREETAML